MTECDPGGRLLILDWQTPWITSLFAALPVGWSALYLGAQTAGFSPATWWRAHDSSTVLVPGWTRAHGISTMLVARRLRSELKSAARPRAIVHTVPWTAGLLRYFPDLTHIYRPHDYFGMYDWDQSKVEAHERTLLAGCRIVVPISQTHANDLRRLGPAPVSVLPNGVSSDFLRRLREPDGAVPADLQLGGRPIVGCIGQINSSYDLDWLGKLLDAVPEVDFVFVGPIFDEGPAKRAEVDAVLARRNARWLGPKPHGELPNYLRRFNVCLNPLRANPANDRRSPLRLYDYLATDKPILSTAIAAAREHSPHVHIGATAVEAATQLRASLGHEGRIDVELRRAYVDQQTWDLRAKEFIGHIASAT